MITITELATKQILLAMEEEDRDDLYLRVAITGKSAGGFRYKMDLVGPEEKWDGDQELETGGITVLIDEESAPNLEGATIDFVNKLSESGFKFENPNSPWSDPIAAEVQGILDNQINPQIASHGGVVTLIDVKDETAYISMGGGCQGCGMADYTLKNGIEQAILDGVPSIKKVLDTTDHAAGENPYYAGGPA